MIDKTPLTPQERQEHLSLSRMRSDLIREYVWRVISHVEMTPCEDRIRFGDDRDFLHYPAGTIARFVDLRSHDVKLVGMVAIVDLDSGHGILKIKKQD